MLQLLSSSPSCFLRPDPGAWRTSCFIFLGSKITTAISLSLGSQSALLFPALLCSHMIAKDPLQIIAVTAPKHLLISWLQSLSTIFGSLLRLPLPCIAFLHLPLQVKGCCSVLQWCPTPCNAMNCSTPGFPVLRYFLEFVQVHVH